MHNLNLCILGRFISTLYLKPP